MSSKKKPTHRTVTIFAPTLEQLHREDEKAVAELIRDFPDLDRIGLKRVRAPPVQCISTPIKEKKKVEKTMEKKQAKTEEEIDEEIKRILKECGLEMSDEEDEVPIEKVKNTLSTVLITFLTLVPFALCCETKKSRLKKYQTGTSPGPRRRRQRTEIAKISETPKREEVKKIESPQEPQTSTPTTPSPESPVPLDKTVEPTQEVVKKRSSRRNAVQPRTCTTQEVTATSVRKRTERTGQELSKNRSEDKVKTARRHEVRNEYLENQHEDETMMGVKSIDNN